MMCEVVTWSDFWDTKQILLVNLLLKEVQKATKTLLE